MGTPLYVVDAFADRPFSGNPAGVCLLDSPRDEAWMQAVAAEMKHAETAFVHRDEEDGPWSLRWFTPLAEVPLCGHATLAAAAALWDAGMLPEDEAARFATLSGELICRREGDWIAMDFPATPAAPAAIGEDLIDALGAMPVAAGRSCNDWLVELDSAATVRALTPDLAILRRIDDARGVIVTAAGDERGVDVVSRFFAPRLGIDEDPVTGLAHCALGPWWARRLGRADLVCYQASARGGMVRVAVRGERVELRGRARVVVVGELRE